MPIKQSAGNMYPWVTHTKSFMAGKCGHGCSFCYVQSMAKRFKTERYIGPIRLVEDEFKEPLGRGRTIFIDHMNDLWAADVPIASIKRVLDRCWEFPENTYMFQTKNPRRFLYHLDDIPPGSILGTTIETNLWIERVMQNAPAPRERFDAMKCVPHCFIRFITIEPILQFIPSTLARWIIELRPDFINIGADSKGHGLPEPSAEDIRAFLALINAAGIEIRQKSNLARLLGA